MVSHEVNPQFLALMLLVALCAVTFVYSSDTAMRMERQNRFDYANPIYLSNVFVAIASGGVGGLGLLMLHRLAKQELGT